MIAEEKRPARAFRGIWTPAELYLGKGVSRMARDLLVEIDSLSTEEERCYASNAHFARIFEMAPRSVQRLVSELVGKGLVQSEVCPRKRALGGRRRYLELTRVGRALLGRWDGEPFSEEEREHFLAARSRRGHDKNARAIREEDALPCLKRGGDEDVVTTNGKKPAARPKSISVTSGHDMVVTSGHDMVDVSGHDMVVAKKGATLLSTEIPYMRDKQQQAAPLPPAGGNGHVKGAAAAAAGGDPQTPLYAESGGERNGDKGLRCGEGLEDALWAALVEMEFHPKAAETMLKLYDRQTVLLWVTKANSDEVRDRKRYVEKLMADGVRAEKVAGRRGGEARCDDVDYAGRARAEAGEMRRAQAEAFSRLKEEAIVSCSYDAPAQEQEAFATMKAAIAKSVGKTP